MKEGKIFEEEMINERLFILPFGMCIPFSGTEIKYNLNMTFSNWFETCGKQLHHK